MEYYGPSRGENPSQLLTRKGADGKLYPYDLADPDYTSCFEVGFRGCFKCGMNPGHEYRDGCPMVKNKDHDVVKRFYRELYIHKPNLKQRPEYKKWKE